MRAQTAAEKPLHPHLRALRWPSRQCCKFRACNLVCVVDRDGGEYGRAQTREMRTHLSPGALFRIFGNPRAGKDQELVQGTKYLLIGALCIADKLPSTFETSALAVPGRSQK